jgi:hypothetical protein
LSFNPKTIGVIIAVTAAVGVFIALFTKPQEDAVGARRVHITAEGAEYAVVPLDEDRIINVPGPLGKTTVEIKGGRVRVLDSPCPNKTCVSQGWVEGPGETIVCLPNRVSITVK